jgi:hypothetical protein
VAPTQQSKWHQVIEAILDYNFVQPWGGALLEEALESPLSEITVVGDGPHRRNLVEGNKGLALVDEAVMKLVLHDQCYGLSYSEGMAWNPI